MGSGPRTAVLGIRIVERNGAAEFQPNESKVSPGDITLEKASRRRRHAPRSADRAIDSVSPANMSVILGIAGASRNASLALCTNGRMVAVCEQERITRTRRAGLRRGQVPKETLRAMLRI